MTIHESSRERRPQLSDLLCAGNFGEPGFPMSLLRGLLLEEAMRTEAGELHDLMIRMAFTWEPRDFIAWRDRCERDTRFNP